MRVVAEVPTEAPAGADEGAATRQRRLTPPRLAALGIGAALALGVVAVVRSGNHPSTPTPAQIASSVSAQVDKGIAAAANVPPQGEIAFHAIQPSVVYINSKRAGAAPDDSMSGAGVVVDATGRILTARHVVHGADSIEVTFADGTETSATIASEEADNDIAVLTPAKTPSVIVPAVLGGRIQTGDEVYAVGHPLDLVDSLSSGVVSGLDRTAPISGGQTLKGLIQFDAAVNPGSSGGPLLNRAGQVVGIVTALANPTQQNSFAGIGFAIPISVAGGAAGAPQQ